MRIYSIKYRNNSFSSENLKDKKNFIFSFIAKNIDKIYLVKIISLQIYEHSNFNY